MRLVKKILLIFGIIFLLSGCTIKNQNDMYISENGRMKYDILIAFDREFLTNVINMNNINNSEFSEINDEMMMDFIDKDDSLKVPFLEGLPKKSFSDEFYIGNIYTYEIDNIDDISTEEEINVNIGNFQSEEKLTNLKLFTKSGYKYSSNLSYIINSSEVTYISSFTLTLPGKSINNNATSVSGDGKKLTWELNNGENHINFSFSLRESRIYYIFSIIAIVFVLATTIVVLLFRKGGN